MTASERKKKCFHNAANKMSTTKIEVPNIDEHTVDQMKEEQFRRARTKVGMHES